MVQVIAHRGSSDVAAEHTMAAYRMAVADGADGLECDVRLTADGHLVCVHDRRVDRTSNGRGAVSTLELSDLADLDFGSWHREVPALGDNTETVDTDGYRVLTFRALLAYVRDCGRPLELAVETKHPTRYAGLVEQRLVAELDRHGWAHPRLGARVPVRVMSFSWLSLRRMHQLAPSVPAVFLMERVPLRLRDGDLPLHVGVAGPGIDIVRAYPRYVSRVHARGGQVHVWTVDEPEDVALCLDLGVDAIITNRPGEVRTQLEAAGVVAGAEPAQNEGQVRATFVRGHGARPFRSR